MASLNSLPTLAQLTTSYRDVIDNLTTILGDMTSYEKGFLTAAAISDLNKYQERMAELVHVEEAQSGGSSEEEEE